MNKVPNATVQQFANQYIPMELFRAIFDHSASFAYSNKFSMKPLMEDWMSSCEGGQLDKSLMEKLESMSMELGKIPQDQLDWEKNAELGYKIANFFPAFFFKNQMGFVGIPFSKKFLYRTPAMDTFMQSDDLEIKAPDMAGKIMDSDKRVIKAGFVILKSLYNKDVDLPFNEILHMRNKDTKLEKHFKFNIVLDYVKAKPLKPLKKLNDKQILNLLDNIEDVDLWLKTFPPENFEFEGFVIGFLSDVTKMEIISQMQAKLVEEDGINDLEYQREILNFLQQQVRSLLKMPDITMGCFQTSMGDWEQQTTWSIYRALDKAFETQAFYEAESTYNKALSNKASVVIKDLNKIESPSLLEKELINLDFKSLLLAPLVNSEGKVIGLFELASKKAYQFSKMTLLQLKDVIGIASTGVERALSNVSKFVDLIIKQQFTSIHPSVEWKFSEVANQFLFQQQIDPNNNKIEPIIFKNIHPIYGQSDIVGSSKLRNKSIEADLIDNLSKLLEVIKLCIKEVKFHLLEVYEVKVSSTLERLKQGQFVSSDESQIVDLLTREIHPLLSQIKDRYPQLPIEEIDAYFDYLDPELKIVYRKRKAYENSVSMLNNVIGGFLDKEDQKMQHILPHFFEKYSTDGVDYNIYLGQDILENGKFSNFYLQDFRLWQLINMCEITRLVKEESKTFPVPLETAQLIFVYNNALSIRFRMDEKQFDVDGAYNVRYEILKKRIDKAVVKGTGERLTQKDKIAIVWLQEKDRREYMEYLNHLVIKGYIEEEIENLELEKLQGAEGLKALRVTVKY